MVSEKIKVSQNFGQISRVSQWRFLRGSERLAVSNFFAKGSQSRSRNPETLKGLGLAEKNAGLAVSQSVAFTISHP